MRVIAGSFSGRRLIAPRGLATRPTTDRVREALFAVLGSVGQTRVLDLFAGTGALGIEALSRGASHVTFVEQARGALVALRTNVEALAIGDRSRIVGLSVERGISALGKGGLSPPDRFDLVFVDPPYASLPTVPRVIAALAKAGLIATEVRIIVEHSSRDAAPALDGFLATQARVYGDTAVAIYGASS